MFDAKKFLDMLRQLGHEGTKARLELDALLNDGAADDVYIQEAFSQLSIIDQSYFA